MNALVVYESLWGNTAEIARAVAEGIGGETQAVPTSEASHLLTAQADLLVAGAPLLGFSLPTIAMRESLRTPQPGAPSPADLSHPAIRDWLANLPASNACYASFETRIWWSPGSAAKKIAGFFEGTGRTGVSAPERFLVTGRYGPLKAGEIERARAWGAQLARAARDCCAES